jgi:hypothetical protein
MAELPLWWHACGIVLVSGLFLLARQTRSAPILVICLTRLPGVILHELAHLLAGILCRARPESFNLVPQRRGDGRWTLGSVAFRRVTAFNAVPIALAPLALVPLAYLLWRCWFDWLAISLANTLLLYGVLFILVANALPSSQDLRVAANWRSLLLYGAGGALLWYLWRYLPQ